MLAILRDYEKDATAGARWYQEAQHDARDQTNGKK
jgi:hypothetical protein